MAIPASTDAGERSDAVGLLQQPTARKTHVIHTGGRIAGLSETSDDYPRVVAILSDGKTRVIVCYAGIQWIVQRKRGEQWHSRSFCQTKEALLRCCGHDPHPVLAALPDRIGDRVAPTIEGSGGVIKRRRRSPEFNTWLAIQQRGRVCKRWRSFGIFYADVGKPPSWRHLLIRDDTAREFSPDNARWQIAKWYRRRRRPDRANQNCAA